MIFVLCLNKTDASGMQWYVVDGPHLGWTWFRLCLTWTGKTGENGQSFKCGKQNPVGIRPSVQWQQHRHWVAIDWVTGRFTRSSRSCGLNVQSGHDNAHQHRVSHACVIRREWKVLPGKHKKDKGEKIPVYKRQLEKCLCTVLGKVSSLGCASITCIFTDLLETS